MEIEKREELNHKLRLGVVVVVIVYRWYKEL